MVLLAGRPRVGPQGCRSQETQEAEAEGTGEKEAGGTPGCSFDSIEPLGDVRSSILRYARGHVSGDLRRPTLAFPEGAQLGSFSAFSVTTMKAKTIETHSRGMTQDAAEAKSFSSEKINKTDFFF